MTLYEQIKNTGVETDSHESDLYVKATPETELILKESGHTFSAFTSQVDGKRWFDVPFAFQPFWDKRSTKA